MKILITGGTGFIGRHFMARYSDYEYTVVSRDPARAQRRLGARHRYVSSLQQVAPDAAFDAVINLAGEPIVGRRWSDAQKQRLNHSRWHMTQALVEWISQADTKPAVMLSGSAIGVYGVSQTAVFDESCEAIAADFSTQLCERWEREATFAVASTRVVLLRTGIVLGADGGALAQMLLPFKLGLGGPVGSGRQWMSWIHMQDYLAALHHLMVSPACVGAYNLTAPEPVNNERFVKALADALHRPCFMRVPAFAMQLMLGEASTLLLDGQRVILKRLQDAGFKFNFPHIEDAMLDVLK
jgi:uncharacterized protein (TIGR01777 family)